jgi:hypothetical protein
MSRLVAVLATLACIIGLTVAPAPPVAADSPTVGESGWSVTLTFPDMQWSSETCQFLPVTAVVTGPVESWTFGGFVTPRGDDGEDSTWYIDYDTKVSQAAGSFTFRHAVMLCPGYDSSGVFDVVGEVGAKLTGAAEWSWLPYRASFTVSGIPTTTTLDSITMGGPEVFFAGRAVANAPTPATFRGCRYGGVEIQAQTEDGWEGVGYAAPSDDGSYLVTVPTYQVTRTQYRATFNGGAVCATSSSAAGALPVSLPVARVSAGGRQSTLKVDIDPDMGRRAWVFQVQRQAGDGSWTTLRTYRTKGSRETRTINLRKGAYRIHVRARFGYAETYSDTVYLER